MRVPLFIIPFMYFHSLLFSLNGRRRIRKILDQRPIAQHRYTSRPAPGAIGSGSGTDDEAPLSPTRRTTLRQTRSSRSAVEGKDGYHMQALSYREDPEHSGVKGVRVTTETVTQTEEGCEKGIETPSSTSTTLPEQVQGRPGREQAVPESPGGQR
jgi:hypothetical protein